MKRRALIVGGGIAGLSVAWWLHQVGIEAVVIDRARGFEPLGHFIALKGAGVEVIRQMGLESACRAREVRYGQALMLTAGGRLLRAGSREEIDSNLGGYILFRRADLHAVLFSAVRGIAPVRYGTELRSLADNGDAVDVELSTGERDSFDLVFGADGVHSHTRRLVFGEGFVHSLGGRYIALTIDTAHGLPPRQMRSYLGAGQSVHLFTTSANSVSVVIYDGDEATSALAHGGRAIREMLLNSYCGFAGEVTRVFQAIDDAAFVFSGAIEQVRLPSIVKGRIALLGDAAHCPTFMSGMGSSLALQGARALAAHLQQPDGQVRALAAYELAIRPVAARYQASALRMAPMLLDRRPWKAAVRNTALRLTPEWLMRRKTREFYSAERSVR